MKIDIDKIQKYLLEIKAHHREIEELLLKRSDVEILKDPWVLKGLKYTLIEIAEAIANILQHILAKDMGVPPTNNHEEQSLRHLVIFRKICFGTRSESGLKTHSIFPSLLQTARRQGVHPREFLQTLLSADTATAQAALYNNSS